MKLPTNEGRMSMQPATNTRTLREIIHHIGHFLTDEEYRAIMKILYMALNRIEREQEESQ